MIVRRLPPSRMPPERLEYAIGLATVAEYLWLCHRAVLAANRHLTVQRLEGDLGIMIFLAEDGRCCLHVDAQGHVEVYKPGLWERWLLAQVPGMLEYRRKESHNAD